MFVEIRANRRHGGSPLAIIEGIPAYFPDSMPQMVGTTVEVMVTGILFHRDERGYLTGNPKCLFIRPVLSSDTKVAFRGFECIGSMCTTTSQATIVETNKPTWLTPGRTGVYVAENVNANFYKLPPNPLVPGIGYVIRDGEHNQRLEGLDDFRSLEYFVKRSPEFIAAKKVTDELPDDDNLGGSDEDRKAWEKAHGC